MKPPSKGKREDAPTHVFTSLAACVIGSFKTFVRYWMRLPANPWYANLSANSTTAHKFIKLLSRFCDAKREYNMS